ncbi:MAG: SAM-dependent methyltransferase, partial [Eubacteriales bacterium]|nr:SAM-dependent methyltransferase [Eubacteriales bacterium]
MLSGLILIPLPIGNPGDLSPRAAELLTQVDLILAEDTRVAGLQLQELKSRASFLSYHAHNEQQRNAEVLKLLRQGKSVALVSDAGMPVISDPGASLV